MTETMPPQLLSCQTAVDVRRPPDDWDDFLARRPDATAYLASNWPLAVADAFGLETYFLSARAPGRPLQGVLPLVRQKSLLFGDRLTSLPFFNYGGPVADDAATAAALLDRAARLAAELGVGHLEIRSVDPPPVAWPLRTDKATLLLDLPESVETLGKQLGSKLRSQVRRAQRESPEVRFGGVELLDDFYRVFAEVMRDLGTPVYPRKFFEALLRRCGGQSTIVVLSLGQVPVSAGFLVAHRDRLEIPWAATTAAVKSRSINMALYWEVLQHAVERRFRCFDFGRSTIDSGPYRFKLQWGARPVPLHWAVWTPASGDDAGVARTANVAGDGRAREWATRVWSRLPLALANRLGPLVSPALPW